ncbi:MAG TPA: hypothetical protein VF152_11330 [Acidimicrobiia bacterium]
MKGAAIVWSSWVGNGIFVLTAVPAALGVDAFDDVAVGVALVLFAVSIPVWVYAFAKAVARTTRGDDIVVASLFFLQGSAPRRVQVHLLTAVGVSVLVAAATGAANPFGVLVPMLPLGLVGLWGARHGTYPPRKEPGTGPRRARTASGER